MTDWATQNNRADVVKVLLEMCADINVLTKNAFGKSSLTEAFVKENEGMVKVGQIRLYISLHVYELKPIHNQSTCSNAFCGLIIFFARNC